ncbi:hypothetical protein K1514_05210 [Paraclostridium bifermentans]|uniref:hypothetical protein n=1 Tax=Paraclostridium bifermentans TaxID=1490 RepID=UPI001CC58BA0|nr:hypothetical protein [Paraclostridium bifermentans]MBZ6005278.1 hypothetical protein [Paraclostridium bifermentans]
MRRKVASLSILTCVICGLCFKTSYALNEDEFLKFLINTSYPETKVDTPKSENEKEASKAENKSEKKSTNKRR